MGKYDLLWKHVQESGRAQLTMTFDEIQTVAGTAMDHSFLRYKKELDDYGYRVGKISLKAQTVMFHKNDPPEARE